MMISKDKKILIVGLGMLGASYAKALKKQGFCVTAITLEKSDVDYALQEGFIDFGYTEVIPQVVSSADIVIFALYPKVFIKWIEENQQYLKSGALLTDVTGVKSCVVDRIQSILRDDTEFIAAHPMAGREGCGIRQSDDKIFCSANYIVTPSDKNTNEAIDFCESLGKLLGFANISRLTPQQHDDIIGFVSQLTHCIAVALMTCNEDEHLEKYTGDSFRDLTRIAKINDSLWSELFVLNKDALIRQMDMFSSKFSQLRKMIIDEDYNGMRELMKSSTARRGLFDKK